MKHSLIWRFLIIIGVTALAALMVATHWPPNLGIDLAGGTSLLYELDVSKLKESNQNYGELAGRVIDVLRQRVDPKGQKNISGGWWGISGFRSRCRLPAGRCAGGHAKSGMRRKRICGIRRSSRRKFWRQLEKRGGSGGGGGEADLQDFKRLAGGDPGERTIQKNHGSGGGE